MSAEDRDLAPVPEPIVPPENAQTGVLPEGATGTDAAVSASAPPPTSRRKRAAKPKVERERAGIATLVAVVLAVLGATGPFLLMAVDRRFAFSVPFCAVSLLVSAFGLLAAVRSFDRPVQGTSFHVDVRDLGVPAVRWLASAVLVVLAIRLAVAGRLPFHQLSAGVLVTGSVLLSVVEFFRLGRALGAWRDAQAARELLAHHGFWLVAVNCVLHLPMLGNFGLIDPWETHYGEVAREMVARDDWISLWWAQDGWFWSKPILNFWVQALSFKLFGVGFMPGEMLASVARGAWPQPEWACRFGVFATTTIATYALYKALTRPFGRRVALVGGLLLVTCPYWFMLARQTMADMVYVAPLTAAMSLLLMAFQTDPDQQAHSTQVRFGRRSLWVSGFHLLFLCVLLTALPQILYLFSRNLTLHTSVDLSGFRPHWDEFMQGSGGGNCGQPGNQGCASKAPLYQWGQPIYAGLLWSVILGGVLWFNRHERRLQRLLFLAAWYATALAVMGKGAPGLVIPLATALAIPAIQGRFRDYLRMELPTLIALVVAVGLPWYVQMYLRHGWPFLDRLIMHDMVRRAFVHVHDTNDGDDVSFRYYLWQLGYGLFPWTGFAAAGLIWLARGKEALNDARAAAGQFLLVWWLVAFGMFTITLTKFHHYILPLVPPTAMLAGVVVAQYLPRAKLTASRKHSVVYVVGMALAALTLLVGTARFFAGRISGGTPGGQLAPASPVVGGALLLLGVGLAVGVAWWSERAARRASSAADAEEPVSAAEDNAEDEEERVQTRAVLGAIALASAGAVLLVGRDLWTSNPGDIEGQVRLLHLFTYNYTRSWPEVLDFRSVFIAFGIVPTVLLLGSAWRRFGRHFFVVFCACAAWFSVWVVDVYFVRVSPHWGQRETMLAYYENRKDENEPLIAYQMNWKGENFYTGNRMATFVATGAKFKAWIKAERGKGISTFFVTTEHTRVAAMKRELESPESVELVTTKETNDKFVVAKVVFPPLPQGHTGEVGGGDEEPDTGEKPGSLE